MDLDNVSSEDIQNSLNLDDNRDKVFKAGEGTGQSGSFFFFSKDQKFLIKTLRGNERKNLLDMLDDLIIHLQKSKSVISRIYGCFTIQTDVFDSVDVIVMENRNILNNKNN